MASATGKDVRHARTPPPEFRQRAVELVREGAAPVAKIAKDLGISESCRRNWMARADADDNGGPRLTSAEKKELSDLQRKNRLLEQETRYCAALRRISRGRMFSLDSVPAGP